MQILNKSNTAFALVIPAALLAACASPPPNTGWERVCDSTGCSDRPMNTIQYKDRTSPSLTAEQHRTAALIAMAEEDPRAAYDLGLRYFRGDGVTQNSYQAIQWMRSAAERGNLDAQKALGRLYLTGLEEMGPDFREAEKWLSLAAGAGDKESKELLAEASRLKHTERQYNQWRYQWRSRFYRNWRYDYPYRYQWRNGGWYY
jgi:hypothetical protein